MTEEDLTFQQLLEKYGLAEENSMEDPDFDPKDLASSDSEDEISETEDDFAHGEIQKLKDDMKRAIFTEHLNGNLENYPGLPANGVESKPAGNLIQ